MPRFAGEYDETFEVAAPLDVAKGHFGSLDAIVANYGPIQSSRRIDPDTLEITLVPRSEKGVTFNGKYACRYTWDGDTLTWTTTATQNMWSTGRARFVRLSDTRTQVVYSQRMETEMQVNALLAKVIAPIVNSEIRKGVKDYLERMRRSLPR
jgi:hypothetical protein